MKWTLRYTEMLAKRNSAYHHFCYLVLNVSCRLQKAFWRGVQMNGRVSRTTPCHRLTNGTLEWPPNMSPIAPSIRLCQKSTNVDWATISKLYLPISIKLSLASNKWHGSVKKCLRIFFAWSVANIFKQVGCDFSLKSALQITIFNCKLTCLCSLALLQVAYCELESTLLHLSLLN